MPARVGTAPASGPGRRRGRGDRHGRRVHVGRFRFVTSADEAFAAALQAVGFVQDTRAGVLLRGGGWFHPDQLVGVDVVSGRLFDGRTDRTRPRVVDLDGGSITVPPTEDMIADRLGRWDASDRRDGEPSEQACAMYALAHESDPADLEPG